MDTDEKDATVNLCDSEQYVVLGSVGNKDIRLNPQSPIVSYDLSLSDETGSGEQDVFLGSIRLNTPSDPSDKETPPDPQSSASSFDKKVQPRQCH